MIGSIVLYAKAIFRLPFFICGAWLAGDASVMAQNASNRSALWVVRDALKTREAIDEMLTIAVEGEFTDLFVQVRGRGDAYYSSSIVPRAESIADSLDPLGYLLEMAKGKAFRVHAWLNVYYVWSAPRMPRSPRHVVHTHPEWSSVSSRGVSMIEEGTVQLVDRRMEGIFLSPFEEDARRHLADCVEEIVSRYPVHGIHLDYIRFADDDYDYSASARSQFLLHYHWDPKTPMGVLGETRWRDVRREAVSEMVRDIKRRIQSQEKDCKLSAAVFADVRVARDEVLQDWPAWIREGLLDFCVMMNYATDDQRFTANLTAARNAGLTSLDKVWVGVALYNQNVASAVRKWNIVKKEKPGGIALFSYEVLRTQNSYLKEFLKFRKP